MLSFQRQKTIGQQLQGIYCIKLPSQMIGSDNIKNGSSKKITPDQIIQYCRQKFVNILPNTFNRQNKNSQNISSQNIAAITMVYKKEEIKQVIRQLSLFLQLVIQNCVLTSDPKIRTECLRILGNFRNLLSRDLSDFENILNSKAKSRLPEYEVDCRPFMKKDVTLLMPPQISLYQDPLLFYIYCRFAQEKLFCNHPMQTISDILRIMTRQEKIQLLKQHIPFFNPLFIPLIGQRLQTKAKFSQLEDRLLLLIIASPQKDSSRMKQIYFPNRPEQQIKNRIKNLCGHGAKEPLNFSTNVNSNFNFNPIKQMKLNQYASLNEEQIDLLIQAYHRYGNRWPVISKYYSIRTAQFLEAQYNGNEKLLKRRQKQGIVIPYKSLKILLEESFEHPRLKPFVSNSGYHNSIVQDNGSNDENNNKCLAVGCEIMENESEEEQNVGSNIKSIKMNENALHKIQKTNKNQMMEEEDEGREIQNESERDREEVMEIEDIEDEQSKKYEPKYKIINHLTFMIEEI